MFNIGAIAFHETGFKDGSFGASIALTENDTV